MAAQTTRGTMIRAGARFVGCVRFAASDLAVLADLRRREDIRVIVRGETAWAAWSGDGEPVLRRIRPLAGSEIYEPRDGHWYRAGHRLPSFGVPVESEEDVALGHALVPGTLHARRPADEAVRPVPLELVREERARPATGLHCRLVVLADWAARATSVRLLALRAACCGEEVLLAGSNLPALAGAVRYWGTSVWVPLGYRPEPALGEAPLRTILGVDAEHLLVLSFDGFETVPRRAFQPLTRAGVRLARGGEGRTT